MTLPKRVLFITYYFPPSGGSGVQRPVKFVKYLPKFGWEPTVLTVSPDRAAYVDLDSEMETEIPDAVEIVRTSSWDPYGMYAALRGSTRDDSIVMHMAPQQSDGWKDKLSLWIRANVFVPDARIGWVPFVVREALRLHKQRPFDAVLTTSPPHSVHLAGRRIARRSGLPWLADFRDPWTNIFYRDKLPTTSLVDSFEKRLEKKLVREADSVVTVSESDRRFYSELRGSEVAMIPNGFDYEDMPSRQAPRQDTFVLAHVGVLNETRNPRALWSAVGSLDLGNDFRIELTGRIDSVVDESIKALSASVDLVDNVSHAEALDRMYRASLLLFVVNEGSGNSSMIPAKVYEYLASGIRIIGIGPRDGDAARLIESTQSGRVFDFDDFEGVRTFLAVEFEAWQKGSRRSGCSPERAQAYSREVLASQLAGELTSISGRK